MHGGAFCLRTHAPTPSPILPLTLHAGKKKAQDPFLRKDWYDIKAPTSFNIRNMGKTLVTRTTGTKASSPSCAVRIELCVQTRSINATRDGVGTACV